FTNKASREMLSRVEQLVTIDTRRIWGGTFHSIGNRLLRQHAATIGYRPSFSILDAEDAKEMMESAISSLGIKTLEKRFPKGDDQRLPRLQRAETRSQRDGLRRSPRQLETAPRRTSRRRRSAQAALPIHPRRRISGHEQAAGRGRRRHGIGAPQRDGRRR